MIIKTIVQRDETGLTMIYEKAKEFDQENALEAIVSCKFSKRMVGQVLCSLSVGRFACQTPSASSSLERR